MGEIPIYLLQCNGCRAQAFAENVADPDILVVCDPAGDCCKIAHHHGKAAAACPRGHGDAPCPTPATCKVFETEGCAGGHCAPGVDGCTVCRPITITGMPGAVSITTALGGAA
jgi:hypothetical protein